VEDDCPPDDGDDWPPDDEDGLPDDEDAPPLGEGSDGGCGGVGSVSLVVAQPAAASAASTTSPILPTLPRCIKRLSDGGRDGFGPRTACHNGFDSPRRAGFNASQPPPPRPLARRR
jgi:hypothetical protein